MELDDRYDHYDFPTTAPVAGKGHPGYLTETQQAQVHQLRMMLEAEGHTKRLDTLTLLRFLRAVGIDSTDVVDKAKTKFTKCEEWRKERDLDNKVLKWTYPEKEQVFQYYPQYYHKTDKDGRPLYIEKLGKINLEAMLDITTEEKMLDNLAVEYERLGDQRLPACSRMSGHLLETCCTIMDLKGVTARMATRRVREYIHKATLMSQSYYPERLGRLYVINSPSGLSHLFTAIKYIFLDKVTRAKFNVLDGDYEKELLKHVPAENLPEEFGGTCRCEGGCQFSDMGPWRMKEWARPADWKKEHDSKDDAIRPTPSDVEKEAATAELSAAA